MTKRICITGAAGNLGSLTALHLYEHSEHQLHLMIHKRPFSHSITSDTNRVKVFACDLAHKDNLKDCLEGVDELIHYAGVLFQAGPQDFLPTTNFKYFRNLVDAAREAGV